MTDNATIAEMKRQIFALENKVRELDSRLPIRVAPAPLPAPVVEPETRVTYPQPTSNVALPTAAELKTLSSIVLRRFPNLGPGDDIERQWKFETEVEEAFRALAAFGRADALDAKRFATAWYEDVVDYLCAAGRGGTTWQAFQVALLSWGDIVHNLDSSLQRRGFPLAFGLCQPGTGRPANAEGWRRVIATGDILAPTPPAVTRQAPSERAPMVKITGGNAVVGAGRVSG